ncbi:shikimate dehydrogenase [Thiolinea disciformis]|uniref:shikimate dehydrogenase n=1 Tax=Thiolinea disciformis TaxID=125614 RepID=UPI000380E8D1
MDMADQYAVIGHPVAHSKSPKIHSLFAQQTQQRLEYKAVLAPMDGFSATVRDFFLFGGLGCNVTVPFKQEAWQMAQQRSTYAEQAGAVNTLMRQADGILYGHNTDGIGLIRDLQINQQYALTNQRVLILGAGGAVRGIMQPLLETNPSEVWIANRTEATAAELVGLFERQGQVRSSGFSAIQGRFDLIINGTSASLQGDMPPIPSTCLDADTVCYDMMYGQEPTIFLKWAKQQGAERCIDGLGMLVEQAAEAFLLWRGIRPETTSVLTTLRASL